VLVVFGVGNPGPEYEQTRHNVGFRIVDRLAAESGARLARIPGVDAEGAETRLEGKPALLVKPQGYVNRSGPVAARLIARREIPLENLLVVVDDFHLPVGRLRLRGDGSDGGHNGLRSIAASLGTAYARLRFGVGEPGNVPAERYVLCRFPAGERPIVEEAIERAALAVRLWVRLGCERAMGEVNRRDLDPGEGAA